MAVEYIENKRLVKAKSLDDIPNSFRDKPLDIPDLDTFFRATMAVRTGSKYNSPMDVIYQFCKIPSETQNTFLLMGHSGCGKSTELNKMSKRLIEDGYPVRTIQCWTDLDLRNLLYSDLLMLASEALLSMAEEKHCEIDERTKQTVLNFWNIEETESGEKAHGSEFSGGFGVNGEAKAEGGLSISAILSFIAQFKAEVKFSDSVRNEYKKKIIRRPSVWMSALRRIAEEITETVGKQPILIFEDLDKIKSGDIVWDIFDTNAKLLMGMAFPVIYTFPIAFSYSPKAGALDQYTYKRLPMIKLYNINDTRCDEGWDVIMDIIKARIDDSRSVDDFFETDALNLMIQKTGGALRDLFRCFRACVFTAKNRGNTKIDIQDAQIALNDLRSDLTTRIQASDYQFLAKIYDSKKERERIEDSEHLVQMFQGRALLEYNGTRWHNVHPLVADFLREQGEIPAHTEGES